MPLFIKLAFLVFTCYWVIRLILKIISFKKNISRINKVPLFNPSFIDCYLKLNGRINTPNQQLSAYQKTPCAFYKTVILADWTTKIKKPGKGIKQHKKPLYNSQPTDNIIVSSNLGQYIELNMKQFYDHNSAIIVEKYTKYNRKCPDLCTAKANNKYAKYHIIETIFQHNQYICILAKLSRNEYNTLCMTPSKLNSYPTIIIVSNHKIDERLIIKERINKWLKEIKQHKIALFVVLIIYLAINAYFS